MLRVLLHLADFTVTEQEICKIYRFQEKFVLKCTKFRTVKPQVYFWFPLNDGEGNVFICQIPLWCNFVAWKADGYSKYQASPKTFDKTDNLDESLQPGAMP